MMENILFWLYLLNSILLINHEIESAYWKEWELLRLPGEITGFLILHFPVLFVILWGLVLHARGSGWSLLFSFLLGSGGVFAFSVHTCFLRQGRPGFHLPVSRILLYAILLVSIAQLGMAAALWLK